MTDDGDGDEAHELEDFDEFEDFFGALEDPLRIEIATAVARAAEFEDQSSVSFSELRERVGNPDSGQFNYHLGKLTGTLLERTDEGYRLHPQITPPEPEALEEDSDEGLVGRMADRVADAVGVVNEEIRLEIIGELEIHKREHPDDPYLSYSDLRERVGERDSGKFNYHLGKLVGEFVERTDEGYRLLDDPGPEMFEIEVERTDD